MFPSSWQRLVFPVIEASLFLFLFLVSCVGVVCVISFFDFVLCGIVQCSSRWCHVVLFLVSCVIMFMDFVLRALSQNIADSELHML